MKTEKVKLTQVLENKNNPRTITDASLDKLVKSLLIFPQMLELRPKYLHQNIKSKRQWHKVHT